MMRRWTSKLLASALALALVLTGPGFQGCQAFAGVVVQQQVAAAPSAGTQVKAIGGWSTPSAGTLSSGLSRIELKGPLALTPTPSVGSQVLGAPVLAPALTPDAAPIGLPLTPGVPGLRPVSRPQVAAPTAEAPAVFSQLSQGAERIATASQKDRSGDSQRQAVDELFAGRRPSAPADFSGTEAQAPDQGGSAQAPELAPAGPRGPPAARPDGQPDQPRQSLGRAVRVGWLGAVLPIAFTFACTALAQVLGYTLHPGYQGVTPPEITLQTAAATMAFVSIMAPVSEEMVFRQGLMGGLRKVLRRIPLLGDFWLPALASSAIFVALHELSDPLLFFTRLVHSMILSYAYHKEGLTSSVWAHAFFNGLLTLPLVFSLLPGPIALIANLLMVPASVWLAWRSFKTLKAQRAERSSGNLVPYELKVLPALVLAGLLALGFFALSPNPIWIAGAVGYVWYALRRFIAGRRSP